jgi:hypothetical protein
VIPLRHPHRLAALTAAAVAVAFYAPLLADPLALSPNPDWAKVILLVLVGRRGLLAGDGPPAWPLEIDGGFPQLAHPHDLFAGPFALPLLLAPAQVGVKALAIALAALGAAGMAALARRGLGLGAGPGALAGALFATGAPVAAYLRSGSINKSFLLLLPWLLVGYHLGGRRGGLLAAMATAAIALDAGWAALFGLGGAAAWVLVDRLGRGGMAGERSGRAPRPGLRWWAGVAGLAAALSAGKLAGGVLALEMPPVALPKQTDTVAEYLDRASFFEPWRLPQALISPVVVERPFDPVDHDVFYLGLPAAALLAVGLVAGLVGARRRWRLAALTAALFFLASQANAAWGPFRLLLELAEPARGLWKLDKYAVVPLAMVLSLWAACGYQALLDGLAARRRAPAPALALGVGLALAGAGFVANRPLVQDLFPREAPPLDLAAVGCPSPPVIAVQATGGGEVAGQWQDYTALHRLLVVRDGGVVSGLTDFERAAPGARPCATLTVYAEREWRGLLDEGRPPYDALEPAPGAVGAARWRERGEPLPAQLGCGYAAAQVPEGASGTVVFNLPYHPAWSGGGVEVDGQLAVEASGGPVALTLETPWITAAWAASQLGWWLALAAVLAAGWRSRSTHPPAP